MLLVVLIMIYKLYKYFLKISFLKNNFNDRNVDKIKNKFIKYL